MCCKHSADPGSVRDSVLGFLESQAAALRALAIVGLALVSWPLRMLRAFRLASSHGQPASTAHIDLQPDDHTGGHRRVVHHSVILDLMGRDSYRAKEAGDQHARPDTPGLDADEAGVAA